MNVKTYQLAIKIVENPSATCMFLLCENWEFVQDYIFECPRLDKNNTNYSNYWYNFFGVSLFFSFSVYINCFLFFSTLVNFVSKPFYVQFIKNTTINMINNK